MIILLDLNHTLVSNSEVKVQPFTDQIKQETYRQWLIDLIKDDHHIILLTARPIKHAQATLESIESKTGWKPSEWYFNTGFPPPAFKERTFLRHIYQKHKVDASQYVAIESNPKTKEMYKKHNVRTISVREGEEWTTLPL